jgi:4-amino-4-deoxy-L-arabinose transferase-like glycosyltransferase
LAALGSIIVRERGVASFLTSGGPIRGKVIYSLVAVLFFAVLFLVLVSTNMQKELSHDEHMYIAAGSLLARDSLLPYRDYPFFQAPNLELIYAVIFRSTDRLLLAARLFNTTCSILSLGVLFYTASILFRTMQPLVRFGISAGSALLLASNPIFVYTSGLAWNHDLPVLLVLLAVVLLGRSIRRPSAGWHTFFAGIVVGSAIGTRLSFAPIILAFVGAAFLLPGVARGLKKLFLQGVFTVGTLVALAPVLMLFAQAPAGFAFDNVRYHQLNEAYWQEIGYTRAMTLPGKLAYFGDVISEPATLALVIAFLLLTMLVSIKALRARLSGSFEFAFVLSLVPLLLAGALAPTPTWYQYFYPLVPLLVLSLVYGMALLLSDDRLRVWVLAAFGLVVLLSGASAVPAYLRLNRSLSVADWEPAKIHKVGLEIKRAVGEGRVLTLAPLYPLEGGASIYSELATGPFGWRMSKLLPDEQKRGLEMMSEDGLGDLLRSKPPKGILVGLETSLEQTLVEYAQEHGYVPEKLSNGATLWVSP